MGLVWLGASLAAAVLFQSSFLPRLIPGNVAPDFVLVLVVLRGVTHGWKQGLGVGLAGGFVSGAVSAAPLGAVIAPLAATGVVAGIAGTHLSRTNPWLLAGLAAGATVVAFGVSVLSLQAAGWSVPWHDRSLVELMARVAANGGIALLATGVLAVFAHAAVEPRIGGSAA